MIFPCVVCPTGCSLEITVQSYLVKERETCSCVKKMERDVLISKRNFIFFSWDSFASMNYDKCCYFIFEQEEDKKMRSYAVIPPMMLDSFERRHFFNNNNGLIEDPMSEYKER